MTRDFEEASKEAEEYGVNLADIPEDDRLDCWPWSQKYCDEINADMARGAFDSMLEMLDVMKVPRGTYSDDRLGNFISMYNNRGNMITALQMQVNAITQELFAVRKQNALLTKHLVDLANWPEGTVNLPSMKAVAASVVDPGLVESLQSLWKK